MRLLSFLVTRFARPIVAATIILAVAAGAYGSGVVELLSTGGNVVPQSDSEIAAQILRDRGESAPNLVVLITESPALGDSAASAAQTVAAELEAADVDVVASAFPLATETSSLQSADGTAGLVIGSILGDDAEVQVAAAEISERLRSLSAPDGVRIEVGGTGPARSDLIATTDTDLLRAELIALPITVLLLLVIFRTPVTAALPLVPAAVAVLGTLSVLRILTNFVEVSIFARTVATALGLAIAIDGTLFLVARYREELDNPDPSQAADHGNDQRAASRHAVQRGLEKAGPSILFSGLTTAAGLGGLFFFDIPLLRSFAYGGVSVILLALVGSLVVLPAVMTLAGPNLDRWSVRRAPTAAVTEGRWYRLAQFVMRKPVLIGGATLALMILAASPITRIDFGLNDDRVLPTTVESRAVLDAVRTDFDGLAGGALTIVPNGDTAISDELAAQIADLDRVERIEQRDGWLSVVPSVEPISAEGRSLVRELRVIATPAGMVVGGEAARLVDNTDHVRDRIPWALGSMVVASMLLLAVLFRSVLLPIKAVVLNLLSLSLMTGAIVWIFQDGRFAEQLSYTPTGLTDIAVPVLMFAVAFGLSMDYEVFLLSRVRDEYARTGNTTEATAVGLQRTGNILSASAILMSVVFLAFATSSVTHLKLLGIGITLAVLVDAFVVRALLVPAFMKIAGNANWWPAKPTPRPAGGPTIDLNSPSLRHGTPVPTRPPPLESRTHR